MELEEFLVEVCAMLLGQACCISKTEPMCYLVMFLKLNLVFLCLRFAYVPCPHNGEVICQALYECLVDWHYNTSQSLKS